jgi:hypothetical protein
VLLRNGWNRELKCAGELPGRHISIFCSRLLKLSCLTASGGALDLNKTMVLELASKVFLLCSENVLLLGNSGTGKTHRALALGQAACQRAYRVGFTAAMVYELMEAHEEKRLLRFQKQIGSYELAHLRYLMKTPEKA